MRRRRFMLARPLLRRRRRSCRSRARPGVTVAGSSVATIRPRSITSSVSDRPISSSRSAEIEQHRQPGGRAPRGVVPDGGLGADVDAARRVGGDEHLGVGDHLPPDDELLLVAARQRERGDVGARACARRTRSMICSVRGARARVDRSRARWRTAARVWWPSTAFSHSGASARSPSRWRSSGM